MSIPTLPTYFISHGGGPWPWIPEMRGSMQALERALADMPRQIAITPKAILMVSGEWESEGFDVMSHPHPPMLYDYYGFPPHTYAITYGAPGHPALAQRTLELIQAAGLPGRADPQRGFDHGTFSPLAVMDPRADVPVYQVALQTRLNPEDHFALGRALRPLRDEGVLIVGSGLSYHNLRAYGPPAKEPSAAFDQWLQQTLALPATERTARLNHWDQAPGARFSHPREDHLIPLMVALGAAEEAPASCVYHEEGIRGGVTASSFRFG